MADVKVTQREYFAGIVAVLNGEESKFSNEELINFIEGRVAQLDRKASNKKAKTNEADVTLVEAITDVLADGSRKTVTEMQKADAALAEVSNQKVTAVLRKMQADGLVDKVKDKKNTLYFAVLDTEAEVEEGGEVEE